LILVPLSEQLAKADQRYEHERTRADRAEQRASDAEAAERIAHDEAAGLLPNGTLAGSGASPAGCAGRWGTSDDGAADRR
jgi:hypothetical protein